MLIAAGDGGFRIPNNTYKSVRILGEDYNLYYSVWCNNEHELYDLSVSNELHLLNKGSLFPSRIPTS